MNLKKKKRFGAGYVSSVLASHLAVREPTIVDHKKVWSHFLTGCAQLCTKVQQEWVG